MRLILVRHGDPIYKGDTITELGHKQAEAAAARLFGEKINCIYSSSMGRAQLTARHTADLLALPVHTLDFMREIQWGFEGQTKEEKLPYHPWSMTKQLVKNGVDLLHYDESTNPLWHGTRAETCFYTISEGIDKFLSSFGYERDGQIYRCKWENDNTVALFAHGGSITTALSHLFSLPPLYLFSRVLIGLTAITVVDFKGKAGDSVLPELITFNDYHHIQSADEIRFD